MSEAKCQVSVEEHKARVARAEAFQYKYNKINNRLDLTLFPRGGLSIENQFRDSIKALNRFCIDPWNEPIRHCLEVILAPTTVLAEIQAIHAKFQFDMRQLQRVIVDVILSATTDEKKHWKTDAKKTLTLNANRLKILTCYTGAHRHNIKSRLQLAEDLLYLHTFLTLQKPSDLDQKTLLQHKTSALVQETRAIAEELDTLKGCDSRVFRFAEYQKRQAALTQATQECQVELDTLMKQFNENLEKLKETKLPTPKTGTSNEATVLDDARMMQEMLIQAQKDSQRERERAAKKVQALNHESPTLKSSSSAKTNREIPKKTKPLSDVSMEKELPIETIKAHLDALTITPGLVASIADLKEQVKQLNLKLISQKNCAETLKHDIRGERLRLFNQDKNAFVSLRKRYENVKAKEAEKNKKWGDKRSALQSKYNIDVLAKIPKETLLSSEQQESFDAKCKLYIDSLRIVETQISDHNKYLSEPRELDSDYNLDASPAERAKSIEVRTKEIEALETSLREHEEGIKKSLKETKKALTSTRRFLLKERIKAFTQALSQEVVAQVNQLKTDLAALKIQKDERSWQGGLVGFFKKFPWFLQFEFVRAYIADFDAFEQTRKDMKAEKQYVDVLSEAITSTLTSEPELDEDGCCASYESVFFNYKEYVEGSKAKLSLDKHDGYAKDAEEGLSKNKLSHSARIELLDKHDGYAKNAEEDLSELAELDGFASLISLK